LRRPESSGSEDNTEEDVLTFHNKALVNLKNMKRRGTIFGGIVAINQASGASLAS
jgi:hypothetical protein